jgi:putative lysine transport system substrate-binding protein
MAACAAYPNLLMLDFTDTEDNFEVSEEEINIGVSVQKGNTELLNGINEALATLTVDDYNEMMNEAIAVQPLTN